MLASFKGAESVNWSTVVAVGVGGFFACELVAAQTREAMGIGSGHVRVALGFGGGLELVVKGRQQSVQANVPVEEQGKTDVSMRAVVAYVRDQLVEKPEMFAKDEGVRPGVLVLLNDCDWELDGTLDARVSDGDSVTFISTLHGG